jgi:hypothetical protein
MTNNLHKHTLAGIRFWLSFKRRILLAEVEAISLFFSRLLGARMFLSPVPGLL